MNPTMQELVNVIFTKMNLLYGRDFTGRWEGLDLQDIKNDWAHELSGFEKRPEAVKYALQNLPPRAPNVLEFRAIVLRAPDVPLQRIAPPAANPELVKAAMKAAREALTRMKQP